VIPPGQYGAGEVIVWDCGVYSPDEGETLFDDREAAQKGEEGLEKGKLSVLLRGEKLKGSLRWCGPIGSARSGCCSSTRTVTLASRRRAANRSVLSGVAVEELKVVPAHRIPRRGSFPQGSQPMPARSRRCSPRRGRRLQSRRLDVGAEARRLPRAGFIVSGKA
jgi:bifunctional non-homologous end joining protein LigD